MPGLASVHEYRIVITRDLAPEHFEPNEFSRQALLFLAEQGIAADEITLLRFNDPSESRFEQRRAVVHVVAVQKQLRFQPERVSRAKPCRKKTVGLTRLQYGIPDGFGMLRRKVNLETVLTSVSSA